MKDQFKAEMSDVNKQMAESSELRTTYEKLVVEHQQLQKAGAEREKILMKKDQKTKQLLTKTQKKLKDG